MEQFLEISARALKSQAHLPALCATPESPTRNLNLTRTRTLALALALPVALALALALTLTLIVV